MALKKRATTPTRKIYRRVAKDKVGGPNFYHEHTATIRNEKGEGFVKTAVKKARAEPKKSAPKKAAKKKAAKKKAAPKKAAKKKAAPKKAVAKKTVTKRAKSPIHKTKEGRVRKSTPRSTPGLSDSSGSETEEEHTPTPKKRAAPKTPSAGSRKEPSQSPGSAKKKASSKSSTKSSIKSSSKVPAEAPSVSHEATVEEYLSDE